MKAIYFDGSLKFREDYPRPERGSRESLVKVIKAGLCRTDQEVARGYMMFNGVLGHEFVGRVVESDNPKLQGKRVVGDINVGCNSCEFCYSGMSGHCPNRKVLGIKEKDGAFAEYLTLPDRNLYVVNKNISDDEAVFAEPLAACFEIIEQVDIHPNDDVIVIGDGRLGLLVVQLLVFMGISPIVIGRHPEKMELVHPVGVKTIRDGEIDHPRADLVIDCTGNPTGFERACQLVKPRGMIILKSTFATAKDINLSTLVINEITLIGSRCGPIKKALEFMAKKIFILEQLITARYPLEKGLEAFAKAADDKVVKVVIEMD